MAKCSGLKNDGTPCGMNAIEASTDLRCIAHTLDPIYKEKRDAGNREGGKPVVHVIDDLVHKTLVLAKPDVEIRTLQDLVSYSETLINLLLLRAYDRDLSLREILVLKQLGDLQLKVLATQKIEGVEDRLERLEDIAGRSE